MQPHLPRQLTATNQHAKLHVQVHGEFGQVGTGDKEQVVVGHGALDVKRAGSPKLVHRSSLRGPGVDRDAAQDIVTHGLDAIHAHMAAVRLPRFQAQPDRHPPVRCGPKLLLSKKGNVMSSLVSREQSACGMLRRNRLLIKRR